MVSSQTNTILFMNYSSFDRKGLCKTGPLFLFSRISCYISATGFHGFCVSEIRLSYYINFDINSVLFLVFLD